MIKLNNKNITYVALADSNNSLKAPKEIWYADSSNSVKLVYRRKDALIEGEDYEKYHWLKGDGTAFIRTDKSINIGDEVDCSIIPINDIPAELNWRFVYGNDGGDNPYTFMCVIFSSNSMRFRHKRAFTSYISNKIYSIKHSISNVFVNGTELTYESEANYTESSRTLMLFNSSNSTTNYVFSGYIGNFRLTNKLSLIPCKLLKPVPKWLDANGIRRQVGECGMIDLVSGKFYGNVNSVGTFTVENYYERKEWLQGRNGAYIDTNYYPVVGTDIFSVHFHYDGILRNPSGQEQDVFGVNYTISDKNNFIRAYIQSDNRLSCSYFQYAGFYPAATHSEEWDIVNLMIDDSYFKYIANGTEYSFDNNGIQFQVCPYSLFVFKNNDQIYNRNCYFHGDIFSFKITDTSSNTKMNLIPCTLTMDLPASMDANNIARTKGTSGMWDLVSDRFYGNVANSGTFKAVNLAEGVDYEVYDWLRGDGTAYIEGIQYNLWDNHIVLRVGKIQNPRSIMHYSGGTDKGRLHIIVNTDTGQSEPYLMVTFRELDLPAVHIADIRPFSSMPDIVDMDFYISNSTFYCEQNGVIKTNNPSQTAIESSWSSITPKIQSSKMSYIREVLPNGSYNSNLIPVKLLRSIPSKYDANGIARQVGECGMYDTVNDVFYGNVASSGTFSVEDDS